MFHLLSLISARSVGAGIWLTHGAYKNIKEPGDDEETHDGQEDGADTAALARIIEHASGPIKLAVAL